MRQSGWTAALTEDDKTSKSPSKPKSMPPQPENRERTRKNEADGTDILSPMPKSITNRLFFEHCPAENRKLFQQRVLIVRQNERPYALRIILHDRLAQIILDRAVTSAVLLGP